jgi:hypothetical protein
MREFEADLLIGGAALRRLRGELEAEERQDGSCEWLLSGQLHLTPNDWANVRLDRQYRLELADGRSGQVVVTRVAVQTEQEVVANFHHLPRKPRT